MFCFHCAFSKRLLDKPAQCAALSAMVGGRGQTDLIILLIPGVEKHSIEYEDEIEGCQPVTPACDDTSLRRVCGSLGVTLESPPESLEHEHKKTRVRARVEGTRSRAEDTALVFVAEGTRWWNALLPYLARRGERQPRPYRHENKTGHHY